MSTIYLNLKEFARKNGLPKKLVVDVEGYGLYNTTITYGILCLYNKRYINTYSKIEFRKLINNGNGVFENISDLVETTLSEIMTQLPEGSALTGKNLAILMGVSGEKFQVCCLHKFSDTETLHKEFEYIFRAIIKKYKESLHEKK